MNHSLRQTRHLCLIFRRYINQACNFRSANCHTLTISQHSSRQLMSVGPLHSDALQYRCIDTDYGGTYHKGDSTCDLFRAIGTRGCHSCDGVYMRLSPTTCFVAHINASHRPVHYSQEASDDELYDLRVVTDLEGGYVRDEVLRLLDEESTLMRWPHVDQVENVMIVCPAMKHPTSGATLSGTYVVRAVQEFLNWRHLHVDTMSEGFVVTHDTDVVQFLPWTEDIEGFPSLDKDREFVAHIFHGDEWPRWFIDIGRMWEPRRGSRVRAASVDLTRGVDSECFQSKHGEKDFSIEKCKGRWDRGGAEEDTEPSKRRFSS